MVRNPVEMIHPLHSQLVEAGLEEVTKFTDAMSTEPGSLATPISIAETSRATSRRWFETFGRERVHVIVFEDLVSDAASTFRRVLAFLDVDTDYQPEFAAYNASYRSRFPTLRRVARTRFPQWVLWHALPHLLGDARAPHATWS